MRTPVMLRAVIDIVSGNLDALDQLDDSATNLEQISLYWMLSKPMVMFLDYSGKRKHESGMYIVADYHFFPAQPEDHVLRNNNTFTYWCDRNRDTIMEMMKLPENRP